MSTRANEIAALKQKVLEVYSDIGTITGTARETGADRMTVRKYIKEAGVYDSRPLFAGKVSTIEMKTRSLPKKGGIKRYIITSAQNNTKVNQRAWDNLLALAEHYRAEVLVTTYTYNKSSYGQKAVKRNKGPTDSDARDLWYDEEIKPYICDDQIQIAPGLVFCGEMNILPTAIIPLTGLESYTARNSSIFGHAKMHMRSVASNKTEPAKFIYTTGTITKRNYIAKKEGLKADFHHVYGALIVEVDSEGNWYVRQLSADRKGVICDLDLMVDDCEITKGNRVESIVWGDIHECTLDAEVDKLAWGKKGMLDTLKAKYQFMHDLVDFRSRNPHTLAKRLVHDQFRAYIEGHDSVEGELTSAANFLVRTSRAWCKTVVVDSNHDHFASRWLQYADYRKDPANAVYFLEMQLHVYRTITENPQGDPHLLAWAMKRILGKNEFKFLAEDESFVLKDIEHGLHGHAGPNGARGNASNLARMGRKINRGHEHSAGLFEGVATSGISGRKNQGYNSGPCSWSASHIVTYANGKRAIYTMWNGKWKA